MDHDDHAFASALRQGDAFGGTATCVRHAHFLVLATGAGFSADSGLATYDDICAVPVYDALGLTYARLCEPDLLLTDPDLFWGFWGHCYNAYATTQPHSGYSMVRQWRERMCKPLLRREEEVDEEEEGERLYAHFERRFGHHHVRLSEAEGIPVAASVPAASPFMHLTSNVDGHALSSAMVPQWAEVNVHGSMRHWQCSVPCSQQRWLLPPGFRFHVDERMRGARDGPPAHPGDPQHDGTLCGTRNRPVCPLCGASARPAVLMFGDNAWVEDAAQGVRWMAWKSAVLDCIREFPFARIAILEIGAGKRVPTIRHRCERLVQEAIAAQQKPTDVEVVVSSSLQPHRVAFIRVNPQHAAFPRRIQALEGVATLSLYCTAMTALRSVHMRLSGWLEDDHSNDTNSHSTHEEGRDVDAAASCDA